MPRKKTEEEQQAIDKKTAETKPKKRISRLFQAVTASSDSEKKPKRRILRKKADKAEKDSKQEPSGNAKDKPEKKTTTSKTRAKSKSKSEDKEDPAQDTPKFTLRKSESKKRTTKTKSESEDSAEDKPKFTLRKRKTKETEKKKPVEKKTKRLPDPKIVAPEGAEDILAHLSWRPQQETPPVDDGRDKAKKTSLRKSENRTKVTKQDKTEEEIKPKKAVAVKKPKPEKPKREHIPIPEDAAQVIVHEDLPSLVHKKQIIPPLSLCTKIENNNLDAVADEIQYATDNGIHLITLKLNLEIKDGSADAVFELAKEQTKSICKIDSDALFLIRLNIVEPKGWEKKFKKAGNKSNDSDSARPSVCDDEFWTLAESCLVDFTKSIRKVESVIGIHIDYGEWFVRDDQDHDTSESALEKFHEWLGRRYRDDDVALRAAWFDGSVEIEKAAIPAKASGRDGEESVRTSRYGRRWVDYNLFVSDTTVDRIAKLSYAVKKASEGWLLVGVSYGYTFEWSHPANGHLSLGKLLRCPDIDYVAGPPSYRNRQPGSSAPFPGPIDSFALNGKLFLSEDDFKTPISGAGTEPDSFNPVMTTPQALESAHWRSAGAALAHRSGAVWTDSWGNGWLSSRGIWERASFVKRTLSQCYATEHGDTDVAVLIDERSLAYLVDDTAFESLVQNVRESVLRSGLSASFYLLSDLAHRENFPEAKLYVFLNAWDIRPEVRSSIKTRLQKDNKVLFWLYCAGLFEAGRDALERVREVTGIALKPQPFHSRTGTTLLDKRHPLCETLPADEIAEGGKLEPSYFAIPEESTVLGEYTHSGLTSFLIREYKAGEESEHSWKSVFLGEPIVSPGLFRALGQLAGAHVWNFDDDVIHCRKPFLTVHCKGAGKRTITLPNNWDAYDLINESWSNIEGTSLRFNAIDGASHVFLIGIKSDIEAMLNADVDDLLKIDKLDPRVENTVHWDAVQFDVEIMKLDEWMEETWSEELADDLLLKPSMIDEIDEDEEEPPEPKSRGGRRRRGQGRRGGRPGRGSGQKAEKPYDESGVGVLFRKSK